MTVLDICYVDINLYAATALWFGSDIELNKHVLGGCPDADFCFSRSCRVYSDEVSDIDTANDIVGVMWEAAVDEGWVTDGTANYDVGLNPPTLSIDFIVDAEDICKENIRHRVWDYVLAALINEAYSHAVLDGVSLQIGESVWVYNG